MSDNDRKGFFSRLFGGKKSEKAAGDQDDVLDPSVGQTDEAGPTAENSSGVQSAATAVAPGPDDLRFTTSETSLPDPADGPSQTAENSAGLSQSKQEHPPGGSIADADATVSVAVTPAVDLTPGDVRHENAEHGDDAPVSAEPANGGALADSRAIAAPTPDLLPATDAAAGVVRSTADTANVISVVLAPPAEPAAKTSWWQRLKGGLARTSSSIGTGITDLFVRRKLDAAAIEDLEDILLQADLGVDTTDRIIKAVKTGRYDKEISADEVKQVLASEVEITLAPVALPLVIDAARKPFVILMIGVNGAGKTTTIGKLAQKFRSEGRSVMLAAGDTFRAAAIEQLKVWGDRTGAHVISRPQGSDAAGLAFDALKEAKEIGVDVLMVDTAGRLQNKVGLMAELEKIVRVLKKFDAEAPHAVLLVLDATTGQNAVNQVEIFAKTAGVTGLIMTKLDGTARGGILVSIAAKSGLPVHFIGVGEGVDDLEPFAARDFARAIAGLPE